MIQVMAKVDADVFPFPQVVRIEPAAACNLRCSHCPTGTVQMRRGLMSERAFTQVLHSIEPYAEAIRVAVLYHGGEPLLNRRFFQMVRLLKSMGIPFVKTVSNGMLMDDHACEGIIASGLDAIEFSLDGQNRDENNFIRRRSDYATVVSNIKRLLDRRRQAHSSRPIVYIASTQFLPDLGTACKPPDAPLHLVGEFSGEYQGLVGFKCAWAMQWPGMVVLPEIYDLTRGPDGCFRNSCDHVESTITVRWNGDVVPCCYDLTSMCVLGNIHDADLTTIWRNSAYRHLRRSIRELKLIPLCAQCNVVRPSVYLTLRSQVARSYQRA